MASRPSRHPADQPSCPSYNGQGRLPSSAVAAPGPVTVPPSTPWLQLSRSVRFGDTDAAGVVQFHQLLRWCHEAFEESLERFGIAPALIFPTPGADLAVAVPIVHCSADYRAPRVCGDPLRIELAPQRCTAEMFEVRYRISRRQPPPEPAAGKPAAVALTRHRAIGQLDRRSCVLPEPLQRWLEASGAPPPEPGPELATLPKVKAIDSV